MDLLAYVRALARFWWVVVACALVGSLAGGAVALSTDPVHTGTVTFFATTPKSQSGTALQGDEFGQARVNTYVKLLKSERLADRVLQDSGARLSRTDLLEEIEGSADLNTVLVTATVHDTSRARTLALTQAVADQFPRLVQEIESQGGSQAAPVTLDVVSGPSVLPTVSGHRKLDVATGLLLGLLVGVALAFLLARLDRKVRRPEDLRDLSLAPVLGAIPKRKSRDNATVVASEPGSGSAESFRQVCTAVQFVDLEQDLNILAVTSPSHQDGRTTTATNVALAFAEGGGNVLLIDADLRRPQVARHLGLASDVGLSSVLAGKATLEEALQQGVTDGLTVLASGPVPPNPSALLGQSELESLLRAARDRFDMVILDTPALLAFADAAVLARRADGVIVVVRQGHTTRQAVEEALETLDAIDAPVLGTVLNGSSSHPRG